MSQDFNVKNLFAEYVSGEISEDALKTLEVALRSDSSLRRDFIEYLNIDSALGDLAALSEAELTELSETALEPAPSVRPAWSARRTVRVFALAGALAATAMIVLFLWDVSTKASPVAMVIADVDALLTTADGQTFVEKAIPTGSYRLESGLLHIEFGGGVMVYVEAPAQFQIVDETHLILDAGRLSANVPPAGIGFTIDTPDAEVVDLGTEFSVDVEAGASEVHVLEGLVRVQPRTVPPGEPRSLELRTSQAIRIDKALPEPVAVELSPDRFIRSFDEPAEGYPNTVLALSPSAYYRMAIRSKGMRGDPPQYSGSVLLGDGDRGPYASGFVGGGMRVLNRSTGRGAHVETGPALKSGQLTLVALVYAEVLTKSATVMTNMFDNKGNFTCQLDEQGRLEVVVRTRDDRLTTCTSSRPLELETWYQVVISADDDRLRFFQNGELVAETECGELLSTESGPFWFGTDRDGIHIWDGRLDECAIFDRGLDDNELTVLFEAAEHRRRERDLPRVRRAERPN